MQPEVVVPLLMGCALLWWIGRGISIAARIVVTVVTLALVGVVIFLERGL